MPSALRTELSRSTLKVCEIVVGADILAFVSSPALLAEAAKGAACPDHFLRTKPWPLILDPEPLRGDGAGDYLKGAVEAYRERYRAYHSRCRHPDSPALRDPDPVVVLIRDLRPRGVSQWIEAHQAPRAGDALRERRRVEIGIGSQILADLGVGEMILLTNSPAHIYTGVEAFGLRIVGTRRVDPS